MDTTNVRVCKTQPNQVIDCAQSYIRNFVTSTQGMCLVLLSGGSAIAVVSELVDIIEQGLGDSLMIGLVDERYGSMNHPDSNGRAIQEQTNLFVLCEKYGVPYRTILHDQSIGNEVLGYEAWLTKALSVCNRSIAVLGIGIDGHTAGILPLDQETFNRIFGHDSFVVGYASGDRFNKRVTITPYCLTQLTHGLMVAIEPLKNEALQKALIHHAEERLYQTPAAIIQRMRDVQIYIGYPTI